MLDVILEFMLDLTQPQKLAQEAGITQAFIRITLVISLVEVRPQQNPGPSSGALFR